MALLRQGKVSFVLAGIRKRLWSENQSYGLKRDLDIPFEAPAALISLEIRPFRSEDIPYFVSDSYNQGIIEAQLQTCYVACTAEGEPTYRQWLISSDQNRRIQEFWNGSFPILDPQEALLENAYTVPEHRGKRIMPAAMAQIAEKGSEVGARYVITFVGIDNIPSLKGCKRSGFDPYVLRTEKWFLFEKRVEFQPVNKEHLTVYEQRLRS